MIRFAAFVALLGGLSACEGVYDAEVLSAAAGSPALVLQDASTSDAGPQLSLDAPIRFPSRLAGAGGGSVTGPRNDDQFLDDPVETAPAPNVKFMSLQSQCKLINDQYQDDPTPNNAHLRANLSGAALGVPVAHGTDLYFFFGDTAGYDGIWEYGVQSLPDAVGYSDVPLSAVVTDPTKLCTELRFVGLASDSSQGPIQNALIERDFAAAVMYPPDGHTIDEYIKNPAGPPGSATFEQYPGDGEVPTGAFSQGHSIYLFYTTATAPGVAEPKGSYLARWTSPSTTGLPDYEVLYTIDQRFDEDGALRGDFIHIAPVVVGDYVYLFGSGAFRQSPVHLARKRVADIETAGGFKRYDAASKKWVGGDVESESIIDSEHIGELSVRYFPDLELFAMLNQEKSLGDRITARFARLPEGPWSAPVTIAVMGNAAFQDKYCCEDGICSGQDKLFNCGTGSFFGTHMLPHARMIGDGSFAIDFLVSTGDPYNVALMSAQFR